MAISRTAALNSVKITANNYETAFHALNILVVMAHVDWLRDGVAGAPKMQTRIPDDEVAFIEHCATLVQTAFDLQETFASREDMESSRRQDCGFRYMRGLSLALLQIIRVSRAIVDRAEIRERTKNQAASRAFDLHTRGRARGLYTGLADGRGSPLRNDTKVNDRDLADIIDHSDETFTWDHYVNNNLDKLGSDAGW
ncbi:hypothetical protein F4824DRAFT_482244 [Ustulina deusta]|nr:hypothetical protein F4824DRAFT_482244 [Ustulina deusta]